MVNNAERRIKIFYPWDNFTVVSFLTSAEICFVKSGYLVDIYTIEDKDSLQSVLNYKGITILSNRPGIFTMSGIFY
jgi:hypothetical protein